MYGAMSSSSGRRTLTYAVPLSNEDASIWLTRPNAGIAGGVTFVHVRPPSRVTCTRPSSEPVQITRASRLPGPTLKMVPYTSGPFMSPVIGPPDGPIVLGSCRVRSPLSAAHVWPASVVRQSRCDDTYSVFGSTGENRIGKVHCHRS